MFNQPSLLRSSFSFCNFNFDLKIHFLNISVDEFEKWERRKLLKNNEEERKLMNDHFSTTKFIVLGINEFLKSLMVMGFFFYKHAWKNRSSSIYIFFEWFWGVLMLVNDFWIFKVFLCENK